MRTLDQLARGETGKVTKIFGSSMIKRRIMDMGITKNVDINIVKFAPMGDPIELKLRGYKLSIRKADAKNIQVI